MSTNEDQATAQAIPAIPSVDRPFFGIISERDTRNPIWSGGAILHEMELGKDHATDPEAAVARAQGALSGYGQCWIVKALRVSLADMHALENNPPGPSYDGERLYAPVVWEPPFTDGFPPHDGAFVMLETRIVDAARPEVQIERLKSQLRSRKDSMGFLMEFPLPAAYRRPAHKRV